MRKFIIGTIVMVVTMSFALPGGADGKGSIDGEKAFNQHCAGCHPDGGNVVNPAKTLHKMEMNANGIKTAKDIIRLMRKPGSGMPVFDKKKVSDGEAKAIADYILKTFK